MVNLKPDLQAPEVRDAMKHALLRQKRRQRRWLLVKLLVFLMLLLGGTLFYLQSSHALRHFYLPLVSGKLGVRITAEDGGISLGGNAWLKNVEMLGTDDQPAFTAEQADLHLALASLLPGRQPAISQVTLNAAQARVAIDQNGHTNWDFKPRPAAGNGAPKTAAAATVAKPPASPYPNITLDQIKISHSAIQVRNAQQLEVTLTDLDVVLDHFGRGRTGTFGVTAEGTLERPGIHHRFSIGDGKGSLTQDATGQELAWKAAVSAKFQQEAQPGATTQTVTLQADLDGKRAAGGRLEQNFTLASSTPQGGSAGQFKGAIVWNGAAQEREASLVASNVGRDLLNPFLAALGDVQLVSSQLSGNFTLKGTGDVLNLDTAVTGRNLAFRAGDQKTLTPAVNLDLAQRGALDTARQMLHLDTASLTLQEGGQAVLVSQLDHPVELQLAAASTAAAGAAANINTTIKQLPVQTLQPWLILAGLKQAEMLQGGTLNGQIISVVDASGAAIALDGKLTGSGMAWPGWKGGAMEITQTLQGQIDKLETLSLSQSKMTIASAGRILANVDARGSYRFTAGQGQATIQLNCPQALLTGRALGLLSGSAPAAAQEGRWESTNELTITGRNKPAGIAGTATLNGLTLTGGGAPLALAGKATYRFTFGSDRLAVETARAEWTQGAGGAANVAEVTGDWPLGAGTGGQLKLKAQQVDLAPWLRREAAAEPDAPVLQTLLVDADQTLQLMERGGSKLSGELRVRAIQLQGLPAGVDPLATLTLATEVTRTAERIDKLVLNAAGKTRSGATDQVALNGSGQWTADGLALKLAGRAESLHADTYLALAGLLGGRGSGAATAPQTTAALATAAPAIMVAAAVPLAAPRAAAPPRAGSHLMIDINPLEIGRLNYQQSELSQARGSLRYEDGVGEVKLTQGAFSGGTITGNGQYDASRQEARYAWDVVLKQVDVKPFLEMTAPELAGHVSGKGDLQSRGSGQGFGEGGKRRLQSETGFSLGNGEISNLPFLDDLAQQTRIDSFRTLQYTEFHGRTSIEGGVATLKDWSERGKEQRINMDGTVGLDGKCELSLEPALSKALAGKLSKNDMAQQLLGDQQGFITLAAIPISGMWPDLKVGSVKLKLDKEGKNQLNDELRTTLKGVIEQKLQKQTNKGQKKPKDDPSATPESGSGAGSDNGNGGAGDSGSGGTPGSAKKVKTKDMLNQMLQDRADKAAQKKAKKAKTSEETPVDAGLGRQPSAAR